MKKKLFVMFVALFTVLVLVVCIGAEEVVPTDTVTEEPQVTEEPIATEEPQVTDDPIAEVPLEEPFSLREFIIGIIPDASTVINLVFSVALLLVYKRSLIPSLGGGLSVISKGVEQIKDAFTEANKDNTITISEIGGIVKTATENMQSVAGVLEEYKSNVQSVVANNADVKQMMIMFCGMIKEGFMNANLPQYAKDHINAFYDKALTFAEGGEENEKAD